MQFTRHDSKNFGVLSAAQHITAADGRKPLVGLPRLFTAAAFCCYTLNSCTLQNMKLGTPTRQYLFLFSAAFLCDAGIFALISAKVSEFRPSQSLATFIQQLPVALFALGLAFLVSGLVKADADEITFTHIHIKRFLSLTGLIASVLLVLMMIVGAPGGFN